MSNDMSTEERAAMWAGIIEMAEWADVSCPDRADSPGGVWLHQLRENLVEAWDTGRFGEDSGEYERDVVYEIAGAHATMSTGEIWRVFVDLEAFHTDGGRGEEPNQFQVGRPTEWAAGALELIASTAGLNWLQARRDAADDEEAEEASRTPLEEAVAWTLRAAGREDSGVVGEWDEDTCFATGFTVQDRPFGRCFVYHLVNGRWQNPDRGPWADQLAAYAADLRADGRWDVAYDGQSRAIWVTRRNA